MFGERALYTRNKGLQNKIEDKEESDKAAVRRESGPHPRSATTQARVMIMVIIEKNKLFSIPSFNRTSTISPKLCTAFVHVVNSS